MKSTLYLHDSLPSVDDVLGQHFGDNYATFSYTSLFDVSYTNGNVLLDNVVEPSVKIFSEIIEQSPTVNSMVFEVSITGRVNGPNRSSMFSIAIFNLRPTLILVLPRDDTEMLQLEARIQDALKFGLIKAQGFDASKQLNFFRDLPFDFRQTTELTWFLRETDKLSTYLFVSPAYVTADSYVETGSSNKAMIKLFVEIDAKYCAVAVKGLRDILLKDLLYKLNAKGLAYNTMNEIEDYNSQYGRSHFGGDINLKAKDFI